MNDPKAAAVARSTQMFHGSDRSIPGNTLKSAKSRGGQGRYTSGDQSKVYATPDESLAWDYAEDKSSKMLRLHRDRGYLSDERPNQWTTDPEAAVAKMSMVATPSPVVYPVELQGDVDLDPNWAKPNIPTDQQKAFRADSGLLGSPQFAPKGSQLSMSPHPHHGGFYDRPGSSTAKMPRVREEAPAPVKTADGSQQLSLLNEEARA